MNIWPFKKSASVATSRDLEAAVLQQIYSTASGIDVTPETALKCPAVLASLNIIAQSVAQLPLKLYKKTSSGRQEQSGNELSRVINRPNEYQSGFEFRQTMQFACAQYGNAYAIIVKSGARIIELHPVEPWRVKVERHDDMSLTYRVRFNGSEDKIYPAEDILHLRDVSRNGYIGDSRIVHGSDTIAVAIAAEKYGGAFFKNGAKSKGFFRLPEGKTLRDETFKRLKEELNEAAKDPHSTPLLEDGLEFDSVSQNAKESQLLELQNFSVIQIARLFNLPPHVIQSLDDAKWANIEQQGRSFVIYSLMPWITMWEQALAVKLLSGEQRKSLYFEFTVDAFLRGDSEARATLYRELWSLGAINANQIAAMENFPPPNNGDKYYRPMNFTETGAENDS